MALNYLRRLFRQIKDGELQLVASSLAFSTVLSFIPFVAVSLAILQKMGGMEVIYPKVERWILSNFSDTAGQEGIKLIKGALGRMMSGRMGYLGAFFLMVTSTRLIADMEIGINRVWNIENNRHLVKRMFFYWVLILTFPICLAGYVAFYSTKEYSDMSQQFGQEVLHAIFLGAILFFVYKFVPALKVKTISAIAGAFIGSMLTITVHKIFLWASHTVFNYSKLYGGIAALPLVLLWVLLIWYGVLFGAIVSASFHPPKLRRKG